MLLVISIMVKYSIIGMYFNTFKSNFFPLKEIFVRACYFKGIPS